MANNRGWITAWNRHNIMNCLACCSDPPLHAMEYILTGYGPPTPGFNGASAPIVVVPNIVLGDPESPFIFGDPNSEIMFGIPE